MQTASLVARLTRGRPLTVGEHFFAHSFRAGDFGGLMDPVLMVDHFWMRKDTFGMHRHQGISALTYVFPDSRSAHQNHDSIGNHLPIEAGSLHWFAAGQGAEHHEYPDGEDALVHALQIFVDLPPELKRAPARAMHLEAQDIPEFRAAGVHVRVASGELHGVRSPIRPTQPFYLFDAHLEAGASIEIPVPAHWSVWLYAMEGTLALDSLTLQAGQATALRIDDPSLSVASADVSHFVLMAGLPQSV